jgi:hypothetical protein
MPRRQQVLVGLALLGGLIVLGLGVAGLHTGLLYLTPAFALGLALLGGWFIGERQIERLRRCVERWHARDRRRAPRAIGRTPASPRFVARGGLLIATALANRPPPAAGLISA